MMQTKDNLGNVIDSKLVLDLKSELSAAFDRKDVASVTVGRIPRKGDKVEVNGLQFEVMFVDKIHGILKIRLIKFRENKNSK